MRLIFKRTDFFKNKIKKKPVKRDAHIPTWVKKSKLIELFTILTIFINITILR